MTTGQSAAYSEAASAEDRELLEFLLEEAEAPVSGDSIRPREPGRRVPLSFAQQRLWSVQRLAPDAPVYHIFEAVRFEGPLDMACLRDALREVTRRHEILRASIAEEDGVPFLQFADEAELPFGFEDLRGFSEAAREEAVRARVEAVSREPFDLRRPPLMRVRVLQTADDEHIVLLCLHHIVADGWSMGILQAETAANYRAFVAGKPSPQAPLRVQYADFAVWQRDLADEMERQLGYWARQLADLPALELPLDFARPAVQTFEGSTVPVRIPGPLVRELRALASECGASLFMTLLAAFQVLLARYSGQDCIPVGTPVANRNREEIEPLIGFFVNMLTMRGDAGGRPSFREFLARTRVAALDAYAHQDVPFEKVVQRLNLPRDTSRNPLFQAVFALQSATAAGAGFAAGRAAEQAESGTSKFDLSLLLEEQADGVAGGFEYATRLFRGSTAERLARHYVQLLESIAANPDARIDELPILSEADLWGEAQWNATRREFPARGLAELFAETVAAHAARTAAVFGDLRLTYAELNERANRLAWYLRARGVGAESLVGMSVEEGFDAVLTMLAVVKAGGAYVPLRREDPRREELARRLRWMVVSGVDSEGFASLDTIALEGDAEAIAQCGGGDPPFVSGPENLAYAIHTSGSTGLPKGIAITQAGVVRLVRNTDYLPIAPGMRIAQASTYAFDAITFEVWGPLLNGGCAVEVPRAVKLNPKRLGAFLREQEIDGAFLTTALFNQVVSEEPAAFASLKRLMVGGEAMTPRWVVEALAKGAPGLLANIYGPTECTTFATWHEIGLGELGSNVPIGRPIANTTAYVVGSGITRQPVGAPGEIWLGGPGLARCYLGDPRLTAERFVPDPFSGEAGARLYRTGDVGRRNEDGAIHYLGRRDAQIKLRGFRIEPGEIEAALKGCPGVRDAAVELREGRLAAWVAANAGVSAAALRQQLAGRLPEYMVPAAIAALPALPLNSNGKIDRKALPEISVEVEAEGGSEPRNEAEAAVAAVWSSVLRRGAAIPLEMNYFAAGGDSITAIQIVSRLQQQGWQAAILNLLQFPTIAGFAATLRRSDAEPEIEGAAAVGKVPLGPVQRWFFANHSGPIHRFNQAVMLESGERLDQVALGRALDYLVSRHEMLRARYAVDGGEQWIGEASQPAFFEVSADFDPDRIQGGLDLRSGPVFRAALFRREDRDLLLLVAHHLVVDGVSWRILLEDLDVAYAQAVSGKTPDCGKRPVSYAAWSEAVERYSRTPEMQREAEYWAGLAGDAPAEPATGCYGTMQSVSIAFDAEESAALMQQPERAFGATVQETLLAALGGALGTPAWIDLEGHGREPLEGVPDVGRTVGWFTNIWPFRLAVPRGDGGEAIVAVKEALRAVPRRGVGYGILRYVTGAEFRPDIRWPEPRISFNYLGQFAEGESGRLRFSGESTGEAIHPELRAPHDLDVVAIASGGRMTVTFHHQPSAWPAERIGALTEEFRRETARLADSCRARKLREKTPADFTVPCLSLPQYRGLLAAYGWKASEIEDLYPVSPLQAGLLFETLSDADRQAYFVQVSYTLRGPLDLARFEASWNALALRHSVLRTAFIHEGVDEPLQVVFRERAIPFSVLESADPEAVETQDRARGFRLDTEPLMRITVVRREPGLCQVIWSYHHLLIDGWCLGVLHSELLSLYESKRLPAPAPYGHYIRWVRGQNREAARAFWAEYLAGCTGIQTPPRDLPGGESRPVDYEFTLDRAESGGIRGVASRLGVTLNSVIQGIWGVMLGSYSASEDCVFGTIVSGRPAELPGVESMVGLFINAVPVRVRPEAGKRFSEVALELHRDAFAREPHQYLPLAEIQRAGGGAAFDHLLTFENYPLDSGEESGAPGHGLRIEGAPRAHDRTHYAFGLSVFPADEIHFKIGYDASVYSSALIEFIAGHWREAIRKVSANPDIAVRDCDLVSARELDLLLDGVQPRETAAETKTVIDRFRARATEHPGLPAVVFGERTVSYAELDAASDRVAAGLRERGFTAPDRIAVLLDRSEKLVACILGILKAGCAFVPLEKSMPEERIRFIAEDCGARAVITDAAAFEADAAQAGPGPKLNDLAYLIYTSGSTGKPKGCQVTHANLAHYLAWASAGYFDGEDGGSFPLFTPLTFDLTITSFFLPLLRGKPLHVFPSDARPEEALAAILHPDSGIDAVKLTPAHMALIQHMEPGPTRVRAMIAGGEALPLDRVRYCQSLNPEMAIYNEYGPTETTVGCIVRRVGPKDRRVPIGRPIANTTVYIVDAQMRPCPVAVPGEILIGGHGVSRGYVNRDELNREKFIPSPFRAGQTLYRTGDVGRWLPDGEIEYLGRGDDQLKIRGYRIEPGEIEQCLLGVAGVTAAAVFGDASRSELLGYYAGTAQPEEVRRALRAALPEYMVPSALVRVAEIPLTRNGKTDRAALLSLGRGTEEQKPAQPEDEIEAAIVAIWKEVLGAEGIGRDTNFFDAGGHSLRAMQVASRIRQSLGVRIALREFLQDATPAALAARVRASQKSEFEGIPVAPGQPDYPVSWAQQGVWLVGQWSGAGAAYTMPRALRLEGDVDAAALERAFRGVIARHESLRTAFFEAGGEPRQRVLPSVPFDLETADFSGQADAETLALRSAMEVARGGFDLGKPPLFRARLIRLGPAAYVLAMALHHIVGDGWSMTVFYEETIALYSGRALPPLRRHYKDYAVWQLRQSLREAERYWLERLEGVSHSGIRLPWDFPPARQRDFRGALHSSRLTPAVSERLTALARERGVTISNVFLSVLYAWLYAWTRQDDLCLGVSVAGRNHPDTENMIGCFVNLLPLRVRLSKEKEFDELLADVTQASEEAFELQHYPFERLVRLLNPARESNRQPLINIVYSFQNFGNVRVGDSGSEGSAAPVRIGDFPLDFAVSKFDLTFIVSQDEEGLSMAIEYDTGLFRAATIERCALNIGRFAASIAEASAK